MSDKHECCGTHGEDEGCKCGGHGHDHHGHDHEHAEMEVPTMTITLDDDTEMECYVLSIFDVKEKQYIALLPIGEEEVFLYAYEEDAEKNISLDVIEDDDEYEAVADVFDTLFEDMEEEE